MKMKMIHDGKLSVKINYSIEIIAKETRKDASAMQKHKNGN